VVPNDLYLTWVHETILPARKRFRRNRLGVYIQEMQPEGRSIIDIGGDINTWSEIPTPLNLTILNLPTSLNRTSSHHHATFIEGDGCCVPLPDNSFDLVFSNSVIEHVGDATKQLAFAREVRRLGRGYWVQTPSRWFPLEAHSMMPFWWFYPSAFRQFLIRRWRKRVPAWTDMVAGSRVLSKADLRRLFPEATILTEKVFGISKSYVAFARGTSTRLDQNQR
jgi:hypothetical protein